MPNRSPDAVTPGTCPPVDLSAVAQAGVCEWEEVDNEDDLTRYATDCGEWIEIPIRRSEKCRFCPFCGRTVKREEKSDG